MTMEDEPPDCFDGCGPEEVTVCEVVEFDVDVNAVDETDNFVVDVVDVTTDTFDVLVDVVDVTTDTFDVLVDAVVEVLD